MFVTGVITVADEGCHGGYTYIIYEYSMYIRVMSVDYKLQSEGCTIWLLSSQIVLPR